MEVCCGADKEVPSKIRRRVLLLIVVRVVDTLGLLARSKTIWAKSGQKCDNKNIVKTKTSSPIV